ncbi:MAG TPA: hypothetical protein VLA59_05880 [Patescibacteria group bacterium]|nr:hypothetical protein [Patescibacteria group bacterium]
MLPAAISSLVTAATLLVSIPAEPGAVVLVEGAILQAVAADLVGDDAREVVVLSGGTPDGSVTLDAWTERRDGTWSRLPNTVTVVPAAAPATPAALDSPIRLVVREIAGVDRVTLLRQASGDASCCLMVQDVLGTESGLRLVPVAPMGSSVDAAWVIDLDGDGTDEILATRSLAPLGDISYPIETYLHRWTGSAFEVSAARLPAGSGDTPFLLGDTDGRPGEELGIIATLGRPELHRVSLGDGGLVMEDAGIVADGATAVPVDDARGIAVLTSAGTLGIHRWPFGEELGPPVAERPLADGELVGVVEMDGTPRLIARQPGTADRLHVLGLPDLAPPRFGALTRTPAAAAFGSGPVTAYVGPLPGGDPDGRPAIVYAGRLLSAFEPPEATASIPGQPMAALAGAQPIGLVGADAGSIALLHAASGPPLPDPAGGRLDPPVARPDAAVSVAPLSLLLEPERSAGILEPPIRGAVALDGGRSIAVGADGFRATVQAPPGSRVYVAGGDPSVAGAVLAVPEGGSLVVPMRPPSVGTPVPRYRATLAVSTPAGHGYLATWDVRVLTEPPPLAASVRTPLGSGAVEISGRSVPYATVTVAGVEVAVDADGGFAGSVDAPPWPTDVAVRAIDPLGNEARATVSAVGWLDYRQLPWIPIAALLLAAVAVVTYLRVPRAEPVPRRADDDGTLEELEPD